MKYIREVQGKFMQRQLGHYEGDDFVVEEILETQLDPEVNEDFEYRPEEAQ